MIYLSMADATRKWRRIAVLLLCGVLLPGMAAGEDQPASTATTAAATQAQPTPPSAPAANQVQSAPKLDELVWPAPPEPPRVRYLGSLHSPEDIARKKGFWENLWSVLRGEDLSEDVERPMSVAVDSKDRVIISDSARGRVHIFDRKEAKYSFIRSVDMDTLRLPIGVVTDAKDNIYISDGDHGKIFVFNPDGSYVSDLDSSKWLTRPAGLALDKTRQLLYVVDTPAHDIKVYDLVQHTVLKIIGKRGSEDGEFNYPAFATVDKAGQLYVTDALNSRVQIFDVNGRFVRAFGKKGDGGGDLSAPKGVGIDSEGHIYVADAEFDNFQIFDDKGALLLFIGAAGQTEGKFWLPAGLFIDSQDRIYVADSYNKRVQIFQYLKN